MTSQLQLPLFENSPPAPPAHKASRSGTFVDNMTLPLHRWFRYSAGFSAEWVEQLVEKWGVTGDHLMLDPFVGSGTVPLVCDRLAVASVGIEAHPMVARICRAKLSWGVEPDQFVEYAQRISDAARRLYTNNAVHPVLIERSFDPELLAHLDALKTAWRLHEDQSSESELVWLAITAILRVCSSAGTAQWQYILPSKTKKQVLHPLTAFRQQIEMMAYDMRWMQSRIDRSRASLIVGDARKCADLLEQRVDAVITSPPYANNYDYADALRFEMTFWGEVDNWGDIHDKVRRYLIVSSSQHSSKERLRSDDLLASPEIEPIRSELVDVVTKLADVREIRGGKKHYHTMVAAYCRDIAQVLQGLRSVCRPGARMCWVVGDSAPYGVYCPIDRWIGELALAAGFTTYEFEKLRDRNTKWKNRKHRVPLKEGLLHIKG